MRGVTVHTVVIVEFYEGAVCAPPLPSKLLNERRRPSSRSLPLYNRDNLFNPHGRLGEPGPAPEEPVYEVMSGENIYDRVRESF